MALIKCSECHKEISDKAKQCPYCGCPQSANKPTKAIKIIVSICLIILIAGGFTYHKYHKAQIKVAIERHNEYLEQTVSNQSFPQKPQSYEDLEKINQSYKPTNPGCRLAVYDALYTDRQNLVPFKETKIYRFWNDYKCNFEKL